MAPFGSTPLLGLGKWRAHDLLETSVLKLGILHAERLLGASPEELLELPRRPNGSCMINPPQQSFFRRLLSSSMELKQANPSDVSSAQSDLRVLSCSQLLAIRAASLDFATQSSSHSAHSNFLDSASLHLQEKLARLLLQRGAEITDGPRSEEPTVDEFKKLELNQLGRRCLLALGTFQLLEQQEQEKAKTFEEVEGCSNPSLSSSSSSFSTTASSFASSPASAASALPTLWALVPDGSKEHSRTLLLDVQHARLRTFKLDMSSIPVMPSDGEHVGIVAEKASGSGLARSLHWEVVAVEFTNLLTELGRLSEATEKRQAFGSELTDLVKRRGAARSAELGLDDAGKQYEEVDRNCDSTVPKDLAAPLSETQRSKALSDQLAPWQREREQHKQHQRLQLQQTQVQQTKQNKQPEQQQQPLPEAAAPFWQVKLRPVKRPQEQCAPVA